jgi:hypothetical protein
MTVGLKFPKPEPKPKKAPHSLQRSGWLRRKAPRRLRKQSPEDRRYLSWVRTLPCLLGPEGCLGRTHAHHAIHLSQGGTDRDVVPLCVTHHGNWHGLHGAFRTFTKLDREQWSANAIAQTRARYLGEHEVRF